MGEDREAVELASGVAAAIVAIWIRWLVAAFGCAASSNCSSPRPIDCRRLVEILKVVTKISRTASARRLTQGEIEVTSTSRRGMVYNQEFVTEQSGVAERVSNTPERAIRIGPNDRGVLIELNIDDRLSAR